MLRHFLDPRCQTMHRSNVEKHSGFENQEDGAWNGLNLARGITESHRFLHFSCAG